MLDTSWLVFDLSFAFYFTQLALKKSLACIQVDLASIVSNCDSRDTPYLLVAWRTFVMKGNFIIFSFQLTSPYAYNVHLRVLCLCHRHSIRAMVYLLSPWLAHWINLMWRPWIMNVICIKVLWNLFQYPVELSLSTLTWKSSLTVLRREHLWRLVSAHCHHISILCIESFLLEYSEGVERLSLFH